MKRKSQGFSLLELMVTITIIGVIAGIAFPLYGYFMRRSLSTACSQNLHNLGLALNGYLSDHDMMMPVAVVGKKDENDPTPTIEEVLEPYVSDLEVFHCPADAGADSIYAQTGSSYFWNSLLNGQSSMNLKFFLGDQDVGIPVLSDKENFHKDVGDEINILYADGHVSKDVRFWVTN